MLSAFELLKYGQRMVINSIGQITERTQELLSLLTSARNGLDFGDVGWDAGLDGLLPATIGQGISGTAKLCSKARHNA